MKYSLFKKLLEKGIINNNTILTIKFYTKGLDGYLNQPIADRFKFISEKTNNKIQTERIISNIKYIVDINSIIAIDGMQPEKLAATFNIKADGSNIIKKIDPLTGLPVTRGRKKKIRPEKCPIL